MIKFLGVFLLGLSLVSCGVLDRIDNIEFSQVGQIDVPGLDTGASVLGTLPVNNLNNLTGSFEQSVSAEDVALDKVDWVKLKAFELSATAPQGSDLSFLSKIEVFIQANGQPKTLIARGLSFPEGVFTLPLAVQGVDLKPYISNNTVMFDVEVQGDVPQVTTTLKADLTFDVDVNIKALL